MKLAVLFAFTFQSIIAPIACINTTYSRKDEVEITNDLGHLIIGAFAHHGDSFYQNEVKRCEKILEQEPDNFDARNDLAAALLKLKRFKQSEKQLLQNEATHPGRYKTASNLGVLYKKMGRYSEAARQIQLALDIKEGGHMGLGDYYLKMIQWLDSQQGTSEPDTNFLGVKYSDGPQATARVANHEYVVTLIKNDMSFADAYLVLGDILFDKNDLQMAIRCYYRAERFAQDHHVSAQLVEAADQRFKMVQASWESQKTPSHVLLQFWEIKSELDHEINEATTWLETYQFIEKELVDSGKPASFSDINVVAKQNQLRKPILIEAGFFEGTIREHSFVPKIGLAIAFLVVLVGVLGLPAVAITVWISRRSREDDKAKSSLPIADKF